MMMTGQDPSGNNLKIKGGRKPNSPLTKEVGVSSPQVEAQGSSPPCLTKGLPLPTTGSPLTEGNP